MAEWFFRKKSKGEVERDPAVGIYFVSSVVYRHIKTYVSSTGWKLTRRLSNYGH